MKNLFGDKLKQSILEISDVSMQDSIFEKDISMENYFQRSIRENEKEQKKNHGSFKVNKRTDIFTELDNYFSPLKKKKKNFNKCAKIILISYISIFVNKCIVIIIIIIMSF